MNSGVWIKRETAAMEKLGIIGQETAIAKAANLPNGVNHCFIPSGLDRKRLIKLAGESGVKVKFSSSPNRDGEGILTEAGILECDLSAIMTLRGPDRWPFNLNADEHLLWAKDQGGDGLTSAEEAIYLLIRAYMAFGKIPFMDKWIRCRNYCGSGSGSQLLVGFWAGSGLRVRYGQGDHHSSDYGAVARKFTPLVV
ncbi:MAG: hypothetical protein V1807_00360 [Patescibacteria group bacterium]